MSFLTKLQSYQDIGREIMNVLHLGINLQTRPKLGRTTVTLRDDSSYLGFLSINNFLILDLSVS